MENFKLEKTKLRKNEIFFFLAYSLLILYRVIKSSTIGLDDKGITYIIVALLFCIHFIQIKVSKLKLIGIGMIGVIVLFCIFKTMDPIIPIVLLAVIASKNIEFKKIAKVSLYLTFIMIVIILCLALCGIIVDTQTYRYFGNTKITCHGLGFNHSSALPTFYFFMFLNYFYLYPNKRKFFNLLFGVLIGYLIFVFCAERLRFFLLILAALMIFALPITHGKFNKLKKIIVIWMFPICCVLTLLLGYYYNSSNSIMYNLNIALSNRLYFEHHAFQKYPITLFGQDIMMGEDVTTFKDGTTYFYLDSAYVYLLFEYGILVFVGLILVYRYGCKKAFDFNDGYLCLWFVLLAIDSIIGNQILSIWSIPILFIPFCDNSSLRKNEK